MVDHGGLAMYGATTLPIIEASLKVSRSPSSASRATECDRACSLSFQTLVRTRSQQWFLESLRRFDKPFIIFHHNLYCSLLVGTQTCKTGHGGILLPCDRNTLLRRQKRRSPWWRAPGSRLCQVAPVELNFHKRYQEMVRSKGPKWSNIRSNVSNVSTHQFPVRFELNFQLLRDTWDLWLWLFPGDVFW